MKKYNLLYAKQCALLIFGISAPISILFFLVALFSDVLAYDLVLSAIPLTVGLLIWAIALLRIPFANKLLYLQTKLLNIALDDTHATALSPSSAIFLSPCWFIASGRLYLHRDFIQSVRIQARKTNMGNDYDCLFACKDKTYRLRVSSLSDAKKIKNWFDCAGSK